MSETTCDSYVSKLNELVILCNNHDSTLLQLQNKLNEVMAIDAEIETELTDNANFPTTMMHLRKITLIELERNTKYTIHTSVYNLVKVRTQYTDTYAQTHTTEETILYSKETKDIELFIKNTLVPSCSCMSKREFIINSV